jgi:hypothetical protein
MNVELAVYGYASVVTSTPRSLAPRIISNVVRAISSALEFMCTMCTEAPVAAAFAITSWKAPRVPPEFSPRRWTYAGVPRAAASRNSR